MSDDFKYDVFLSHSAKDKAVVRPLAERLWQDGPFKFGTRNSEFGIAQAGTCGRGNSPFRAPLNSAFAQRLRRDRQERRSIPLRLDDAGFGCWRSLEIRDPRDAKDEILAAFRRENA